MNRSRRRTRIEGQFAPRTVDMLRSPAMRVLSLSGERILRRLEIELANHGGTDNGRLPCTFDHFVEYGIDRDSVAPAIRELVALGFLVVTQRGSAGNAAFRRPSLYRLTFRHTDDAEPTHEWKRIDSIEDAVLIARDARAAKTKASRGKPTVSVRETLTENGETPVRETPTTRPVRKTPTTSISRVG